MHEAMTETFRVISGGLLWPKAWQTVASEGKCINTQHKLMDIMLDATKMRHGTWA